MTTPAHGVMARHYRDITTDQADDDVDEIMRLVEATEQLAIILQSADERETVCEEAVHAWRYWLTPERIAWLDQYIPDDARLAPREDDNDE